MKNLIILLLLSFLSFSAFGQYGIRLGYNLNKFDQWEKFETVTNESYHPDQFEIGVNYWFRLKTKRVEFLPELTYGLPVETTLSQFGITYKDNYSYVDLKLHTQFYLFDFKEDCNCPTFSKQGSPVIKGFFIFISPGVRYNMYAIDGDSNLESTDNNHASFLLSTGAGYDIGITDLFTITPYFGVNMNINDKNEYIVSENLGVTEDTWNALAMGLRFTMRFDYLSQPSWRR